MHMMGLKAIYPKKQLSVSDATHQKYPYLLQDLSINQPNKVWCTDITSIKMRQGFVYLMAIIDVYSRTIVNWGISTTMESGFCINILQEALSKAKPEYINTDQGSQFTASLWIKTVEESEAKVSMDGIGRWCDNIPIERFWRSAKYESTLLLCFETVQEARQEIDRYINFYNRERPHQSLGYAVPWEVYTGQEVAEPFQFKKRISNKIGYQ